MVASLDRKRLGADCRGGAGSRTEAFSIRRLGGSRWRLRRTRCAMGFERQRGSEQGLGKAARHGGNAVRVVGMVLKVSESVCGKWPERRWRGGGHTNAPACGSTSLGRHWVSGTPGKPPAYAGTDFIVARNGRIASIYLFFDNLP
jgi:hypothetical protein